MTTSQENIEADIAAVSRIPIVRSLLEVVCRTTGMGFAAIARVTEDRWIACSVRDEIAFGLQPGGELKLETTICNEIRQSHQAVVIDHVDKDEQFCGHHTPAMYGFQSYISMPIFLQDGSFFGTLCAIDPKPARVKTPEIIGMFRLFADLISFHLNTFEELAFTETKLLEERKTSELREQFIAILGHDLRNPLAAVLSGSELLLRMTEDEEIRRLACVIRNSSFRMSGLIENILDFARGRLGGGIILNRKTGGDIEKMLRHVIAEILTVYPERVIETHFDIAESINYDEIRMAQLFSNLLSNAITHGAADAPVKVKAVSRNGVCKLSIINSGNKISPAAMDRLFHPFAHAEIKPGQQGLGLGLYISSEIAHAHGGEIHVVSTDEETCFTFELPLQ